MEEDRIRDVGAIRSGREFRLRDPESSGDALDRLGEFGRDARFVVGHNVVAHDRRFIKVCRPDAELLRLPLVDTPYLAPLAFPQRPYHALIKDYKLAGERSDPVKDCRVALGVLGDCWRELRKRERDRRGLVSIYRSCFDDSDAPGGTSPLRLNGTGQVLEALGAQRLPRERVLRGFEHFASDRACLRAVRRDLPPLYDDPASRPAIAYALAWLPVRGTESVLARWVHLSFPGTSSFLRAIRGVDCGDEDCDYCRAQHDPAAKLEEYFGHPGFRSRPATSDGESLQARVVERGLAGAPLLAIMPTGGGKSLCYQLPAIVHNEWTGALTVVISPLQALMKDQVENLSREIRGGKLAAALNGLMTLPERHDVLEGVRQGRFAVLYVSPSSCATPRSRRRYASARSPRGYSTRRTASRSGDTGDRVRTDAPGAMPGEDAVGELVDDLLGDGFVELIDVSHCGISVGLNERLSCGPGSGTLQGRRSRPSGPGLAAVRCAPGNDRGRLGDSTCLTWWDVALFRPSMALGQDGSPRAVMALGAQWAVVLAATRIGGAIPCGGQGDEA